MLASMVLLTALAQEPIPDIDPAAQKVMDWMTAKYAALESLRCTVAERPYVFHSSRFPQPSFVPRARLVYRKPGSVLVQRLGNDPPDREKVMREVRLWQGQLTLSSPSNVRRYLTYRYEPKRALTVWDEIASRAQAPIRELGRRIEGPRPDFPGQTWKTVRLKLDAPTFSSDGTPVYVVDVDRRLERDGTPTGATVHRRLQIGQADGLLRKNEWEDGPPLRNFLQSGAEEYHDIVANRFEPDTAFVFRPSPGMLAVPLEKYRMAPPDPKTQAIVEAMRRALGHLDSLSFAAESTTTSITEKDKTSVRDVDRATVRFDLRRPLLARGELRQDYRDPSRAWTVVCDGTRIVGEGDGHREEVAVAQDPWWSIARFAGLSMPYVPGIAEDVVALFFEPSTGEGFVHFRGYRLAKPATIGGSTYDVLEQRSAVDDEFGIPGEDIWTDRLFVGRTDHLIFRWEWDHPVHYGGVLHRSTTIQRFRLATDLPLDPSHFAIGS